LYISLYFEWMDLLSNSIVDVYLNQKRVSLVYEMYTSQINSTFFYFFLFNQIELNFKLFWQFPKYNLPESWIYKYAIHLIESFPPIKHKKKKKYLIQGYVVELVIKRLVTNFNHYISRAWDQGPTMQPEYQEKTTDLSEYSQYTDKLYHIKLYRADPYELESNAQH
jgi:hypothetical protein